MGTSLRRLPLSAGVTAAAVCLMLSGCGLGGSDQDPDTDSSTTSSSPTPDDPQSGYEAEPTEEFDEPQQREITSARARRALPTRADMPDTSYLKDISAQNPVKATYDPSVCAAVPLDTESSQSFADKHRTVREYARFGQSRADGNQFLGVWISSYDQPFPLAYFDEAGEALGECDEFDVTTGGHTRTDETEAIPAPAGLGERTYAVRIIGGRVNTDRLYVRSGHNLITVMQQQPLDQPFDERLLEKHAKAVLDDLKKDR